MKRLLLVPVLSLWLQGCASEDLPGSEKPCLNDTQCAAGEVCYENGCGSALDFTMRVTPQSGGYPVQDFSRVSVAQGRVNLTLQPAARLAGKLQITSPDGLTDYAGLGPDCQLPAAQCRWSTLTARGRSSSIPGLAFEQPVVETLLSGAEFSLPVPAGIWQVSVTPADPDLPPVFSQRLIASGDTQDPRLILSGENLLKIRGYITKAEGTPWAGSPVPIFRAQAIDPVTGDLLSQPRVVPADEELRLSARRISGPIAVQLGPDPSSPVPVPSKQILSDASGAFPDGFVLGDFGNPIEIIGSVVDPLGRPISSAQVRFEGTVNGGGLFTATTMTNSGDRAGQFSVTLLPANRYTITATPPPESPYASVRSEAELMVSGALKEPLHCPPKARLTARVTGPDGAPLSNVVIRYEGSSPTTADAGKSSGDTKTDANGEFSVLVEPGSYRVLVSPGASSRLPWATRVLEAVAASETASPPEQIRLSEVREVLGTVIARPQGEPVPVASAKVVVYPASIGALETAAPGVVYEALSDAKGEFRLLLPKAQ